MKDIKDNDKNLIEDLCQWKMTKAEFETKTNFKVNFKQLNFLLDESENKVTEYNDNQYFEAIFWSLPKALSIDEKAYIYRKYLLKTWHHEHEEIVGTFQIFFNNEEINIPILLEAINTIPEYLRSNDFKYSYIRKIIYAIGAQPEPNNIQALEKLANETDDEQIKELAFHQIDKRKELGRWEFIKNEK